MTVCVALLCDGGKGVVGLSDRMVTATDVEFEPENTKIVPVSNSIAIMTAGDSASNASIVARVTEKVRERIKSEPEKWWRVDDVAQLYQQTAANLSAKRGASSYLEPLGLNLDSFITRQAQMQPSLVNMLATELINYSPPYAQAIVTGIDETGAHIYVVDRAEVNCYNKLGFAAIGVGQWHASSYLMFQQWSVGWPAAAALFEGYVAKKRSEVAPGVGVETDVFWVLELGGFQGIDEETLKQLETIYNHLKESEEKASGDARREWVTHLNSMVKEYEEKQPDTPSQVAEVGDGGSPANEAETEPNKGEGDDHDQPSAD